MAASQDTRNMALFCDFENIALGVRDTRYAKFEDINEAIKPILQKHGFAITYKIDAKDGIITVTGILVHRDGHRERH